MQTQQASVAHACLSHTLYLKMLSFLNRRYFAWDSLDAACFLQPSICKMQQEVVQIVLEGPSQGFMRVKGQNNSSSSNGGKAAALSQPKQVIAAVDADAKKFDDFVFSAFAN